MTTDSVKRTTAGEFTLEVVFLHDLLGHDEDLRRIQEHLVEEWGPYGPASMEGMYQMAENGGKRMFVARLWDPEKGGGIPLGILQTVWVDVGGDTRQLVGQYKSVNAIIRNGTWEGVNESEGDTAILVQITIFEQEGLGRNLGIGSLLRVNGIQMLPDTIKYIRTLTPVPNDFDIEGVLTMPPEEYTPAMRFHYRGGAVPVGYQKDYKVPDPSWSNVGRGRQNSRHIVFMGQERGPDGWVLLR